MFMGVAAWQKAVDFIDSGAKDEINSEKYNAAFVSGSKDLVTVCICIITVAGLVLDLLCLKWLSIASSLFYLELLYSAMIAMFPYAKGIAASQ